LSEVAAQNPDEETKGEAKSSPGNTHAPGGKKARIPLLPFDYVLLGVATALLVPVFRIARLPLRVDFGEFASAYWGGTAAMAVAVAMLYGVLGLPPEQTFLPTIRRFREKKILFLVFAALAAWLIYWLGATMGLVVTLDGLGLAELLARRNRSFESEILKVFIPGMYLFVGLILVFAFNHAIAGIRNPEMYDQTLQRLDWQIFHINVSTTAHWVMTHLPHWYIKLEEVIYGAQFPCAGAALILLALLGSQERAEDYARAALLAYFISVILYYFVPAKGPYAICAIHVATYPRWLQSFWAQETLVTRVQALWAHHLAGVASVNITDYFISFPSMHAALPPIEIWYMRRWKWIAGQVTLIYVVCLLPALVLLEWHYVVDIVGGIAVAALAIWLERSISRHSRRDGQPVKMSDAVTN